MTLLRRLWRDRSGASAVEFSLVIFPFFLVVFGTIEFGRAMWTRETLHSVAAAGARCMGMVQSNCGTGGTYSSSLTKTYAQSIATSWGITVDLNNITVPATSTDRKNGTCAGVTAANGFSVMTVQYDFQTAVPNMISFLVPLPLTVTTCFPNQS